MNREEAIKTLILLLSTDSWIMFMKVGLPEPNRQRLIQVYEMLMRIILEEEE